MAPKLFFPPENNIGDGRYKTPVTFVFLFLYSVIIARPKLFNARRERKNMRLLDDMSCNIQQRNGKNKKVKG
jgi:hypothetical protein